jgi:fatty acid desaturase
MRRYWLGLMIFTGLLVAFDYYYGLWLTLMLTSILFGFALSGFLRAWHEMVLEKKRAAMNEEDEAFIKVMGDLEKYLRGQ